MSSALTPVLRIRPSTTRAASSSGRTFFSAPFSAKVNGDRAFPAITTLLIFASSVLELGPGGGTRLAFGWRRRFLRDQLPKARELAEQLADAAPLALQAVSAASLGHAHEHRPVALRRRPSL